MEYKFTNEALFGIEEIYNEYSRQYADFKDKNCERPLEILSSKNPKYKIIGMQIALNIIEIKYEILDDMSIKIDKTKKYEITKKIYDELVQYNQSLLSESKCAASNNANANTIEKLLESDGKICMCACKIEGLINITHCLGKVYDCLSPSDFMVDFDSIDSEERAKKTNEIFRLYRKISSSLDIRKEMYFEYEKLIKELQNCKLNNSEIMDANIRMNELKKEIEESKQKQLAAQEEVLVYKKEINKILHKLEVIEEKPHFEKDIME